MHQNTLHYDLYLENQAHKQLIILVDFAVPTDHWVKLKKKKK